MTRRQWRLRTQRKAQDLRRTTLPPELPGLYAPTARWRVVIVLGRSPGWACGDTGLTWGGRPRR